MSGRLLYIGLMSGTSMDGIDAALVEFNDRVSASSRCVVLHGIERPFSAELKNRILNLCNDETSTIDELGTVDRILGEEFAKASLSLIDEMDGSITKDDIIAIGSHGQTIRHRPDDPMRFTLQISDPNTIAVSTGITTIADFRRCDMAYGGQGAPLAPAFHQYAFGGRPPHPSRLIVNIGGISNVTPIIHGTASKGYDTGPGNVLMDAWIHHHLGVPYDEDGSWANGGTINEELLRQLLKEPYLSYPPPKSTGRELFNLSWIASHVSNHNDTYQCSIDPQDVQATLLEFTARTICSAIDEEDHRSTISQVYVCGGGAYNVALMRRISQLAHPKHTGTTKDLGISPRWVEAAAFAWLAHRRIQQKSGNVPKATGASQQAVLGAIYDPIPSSKKKETCL